jgi:hypothetical protein
MGLCDGPAQLLALSLSKGGLQRSEPGFDKLSPGGFGEPEPSGAPA